MTRTLRPAGTLAFLMAWLVPWRPAFRARAQQSGLSFYLHRRDALGRHVAKYGGYEPLLTTWVSDHLAHSSPGIFIDVGANVGWHSIHAVQHKAVETAVAFEPDPFNAWLLDRNLSLNRIDNVVVSNAAVGARRGLALLHRYKPSNLGRHSMLADYGYGSRTVPVTDLDAALDAIGLAERRVLILKIDVEGYEPAVIAGAAQTLARTDVVITEYSPALSRAGGLSLADMVERLHAAGFSPHRFSPDGRVGAIAPADLRIIEGQLDLVWMRPATPAA